MIEINLIAPERKAITTSSFSFQTPQKVTVLCSLTLIATSGLIGWRFWAVTHDSARLDQEISSAQQEMQRLHPVIQQVQQLEEQRAQLQQRVGLIEELRRNQAGPVHMLDQISRALPGRLWLTGLKQGADPNEVLVEGRAISLTSLSDFVANLEASGYFKRSVEIVSTLAESIEGRPDDLIRFQVRAMFQQPGAPAAPAPPAAAASAPATAAEKKANSRVAQWN
jgi:type IV pilus assembly protein PilN